MANSIRKTTLFTLVLACVFAMVFSFSAMKNTSYAQENFFEINSVSYNSTINQHGTGWDWNASTKTLTLNNFTSANTGHPIWMKNAKEGETITIYLVGNNTIYGNFGDGAIRLGDISSKSVKAKYIIDGDPNAFLGITNNRGTSGNYTEGIWMTGSASELVFKNAKVGASISGAYSPSFVYCDSTSKNQQVTIESGIISVGVTGTNANETAMVFRNQISVNFKTFDYMRLDAKNSADSSKAQIFNSSCSISGGGAEVVAAAGSLTSSAKEFRGTKLAKITRIYGQSRYDTAINVSQALNYAGGGYAVGTCVVASGDNYPDALAGGYLAKYHNAPLLLVTKSTEDKIFNYIVEEGFYDVYILGGEGAVSKNFENRLRNASGEDIYVRRLAGKNRYETNMAILEEVGVNSSSYKGDILVCTGNGFADSLSASGTGQPILLVGDSITTEQYNRILSKTGSSSIYLIGGEGVVNNDIKQDLETSGYGFTVRRVSGANRYATSRAVADTFCQATHNNVVLAYAQNFPDGLSGGPLAVKYDAPLLLVDANNYSEAKAYAKAHNSQRAIILGGPTLIPNTVASNIVG